MGKAVCVQGSQQATQSIYKAEPSAAAGFAKEGGRMLAKHELHGRTTSLVS